MNLAFVMTTQPETLGERIRRLRLEKDFRQEDVAQAIGVTPQTIGAIERKSIFSAKLPDIADFLGCSFHYLRTGEEEPLLKIVPSNESDVYSVDEVREALPRAFSNTVNMLRKQLMVQGKVLNGDIPLLANKDLFLEVFTKAVMIEVTGDYFINENTVATDNEVIQNGA